MDTKKLNMAIGRNGLKKKEVATLIGLNYRAFWRRTSGVHEFTVSQIKGMIDVLRLSPQETHEIFFS